MDLKNELEKLCIKLNNEWLNEHKEVPKLLYHYTDINGLDGIISSKKLWASNIFYMNDKSEIQYSCSIVKEVLEEKSKVSNSEAVKMFLERVMKTFNSFEDMYSLYIICFCKDGNLLSQWRGYAANGAGFSIGFDTEGIGYKNPNNTNITSISGGPYLRRVIYDTERQKANIKKIVEGICSILDRVSKVDNAFLGYCCHCFSTLLGELLFSFKHESFKDENEWRLVFTFLGSENIEKIKFRVTKNSLLVPYYEMNIENLNAISKGKNPIKIIRYGPTLRPELARKSLDILLEKHKYRDVVIEGSDIPLTS